MPLWAKHVCVWLLYCLFVFTLNTLTDPNITFQKIAFSVLPFAITFYIIIYCLGLYKTKGVQWGIATFFIIFIVMGSLGFGYWYFLMPSLGVQLYKTREINYFFLWGSNIRVCKIFFFCGTLLLHTAVFEEGETDICFRRRKIAIRKTENSKWVRECYFKTTGVNIATRKAPVWVRFP